MTVNNYTPTEKPESLAKEEHEIYEHKKPSMRDIEQSPIHQLTITAKKKHRAVFTLKILKLTDFISKKKTSGNVLLSIMCCFLSLAFRKDISSVSGIASTEATADVNQANERRNVRMNVISQFF